MEAERCPVCDSASVVAGWVAAEGAKHRPCFVSPDTTVLFRSPGVPLPYDFLVCLSCGHLWSSLPPKHVRDFIRTHGTELARQQLDALDFGPLRGLPDIPEAHEAGHGVAEIDNLIAAGKAPEATRRYRELTKTTWDQAIDAVRGWRDLKRPEKLARFGWVATEKAKPDEIGAAEHPMRDRLLDG